MSQLVCQPLFQRVADRSWAALAPLAARIIWLAGPAGRAQSRAFAFASRVEELAGLVLGERPAGSIPIRTHLMNSMICEFCCMQRGFPIDYELAGRCKPALERPGEPGKLVVTVHTKLGLTANAALRTGGRGPVIVMNPRKNMVANSWGSSEELDYIDAKDPSVFLKARRAIAEGRTLVAFVDFGRSSDGCTYISPNFFGWAASSGVPVFHALATLGDRGQVTVEIAKEPAGLGDAASKAKAFVEFVQARWPRRFLLRRRKDLALEAGTVGETHPAGRRHRKVRFLPAATDSD
jgi:hypothetical protein